MGGIDLVERGVKRLGCVRREPANVVLDRSQCGPNDLQVFIQNLRGQGRAEIHALCDAREHAAVPGKA